MCVWPLYLAHRSVSWLINYLLVTRPASPQRGGTLRSVPRGDAMHRGSRPRGLLSTRGRTGLASTVVPVLVGVILAFAWNMATSHGPQVPQPGAGLAPTVGTAVDQAADRAWASATPITTHLPYRGTPSARDASRGPASTSCRRAGSSHVVRTGRVVDSAHASACSSPRRLPETPQRLPETPQRLPESRKTTSAVSASTTAWSVHRKPGYSSTLIVVMPTREKRR